MYKCLQKIADWLDKFDFSIKCFAIGLVTFLLLGVVFFSTYDWDNMKPTTEDYEELQLAAEHLVDSKEFYHPDNPAFENISSYDISSDSSGYINISLSHKDSNALLKLTFNEELKLQTQEQSDETGGVVFALFVMSLFFAVIIGFVGGVIVTIIQAALDTLLEHLKKNR